MSEPNLDLKKWLKDNGWLWHESSVITPECMDDLQAYIANQVREAKIEAFDVAFDCHDYDRLRAYRATLEGDDK